MKEILLAGISALWLGVLTSISPCPLATNIAAVSYLSKKVARVKTVLLAGTAYTLGRMSAYAIIGFVIIASLLSVPAVARFLQEYINKLLGPVLIVTGLFLLDLLKAKIPGTAISPEKQERLANSGVPGAFALGFVFALAFCPFSAALFFGSLIPLALRTRPGVLLPFIYGLGTGLPVFFFALAISFGAHSLSRWLRGLSRAEYYLRKATGIIFILVGLHFIWAYIVIGVLK